MEDTISDLDIGSFLKRIRLAGVLRIDIIFLVVFLIFLLKFSSVLSGSLLVHESPYQFVAGDMFWLTLEGMGIMNTPDISVRAPFLMRGDTGVFNNFTFILPMFVAELSFFTGFEPYDVMFHLNLFFMAFTIITTFFILRKINVFIAIAGIPLALFIYDWPFNYVLTWGAQMTNTNMFLIGFVILAFMYLEVKYMFIVLGALNAVSVYCHAREALMFNLGVLFFFILQVILKKLDKKLLIKYIFSAIVTVILVISWLPVMHDIFAPSAAGTFLIKYCPSDYRPNTHKVVPEDLGFFRWFIIGGVVLAIGALFFSKMEFYKKFGIIAFLSFLFNSYFCVLGNKTTQIRHFFPVTLAVFLGFFIWTILSGIPVSKNVKKITVLVIAITFLVVLLVYFFPKPVVEYAFSNPPTYEAFKWMKQNVKDDEFTMFLYGDNFYQETLFFLPMKLHDLVKQEDFLSKVSQNNMTPAFDMINGSMGHYFRRSSYFHLDYFGMSRYGTGVICNYDYVFFNKVSQYPVVTQYIQEIKRILTYELNFTKVYENELVYIFKNPNVGGDCFESRKFITTGS